MPAGAAGTADAVWSMATARPATLGAARLVCVDGPAGSGKTTLAEALAARAARDGAAVTVVHVDDLLEGWRGLPTAHRQISGLLQPLAAGGTGRYRRWDWLHHRFTRTVEVDPLPPGSLLLLEGVGAGSRVTDPWRTVLVWVEVPPDVRRARAMARDGERLLAPHWDRWTRDEEALFAAEETRARADLAV